MDGALYHNNPIKVADSERKLVWANSRCSTLDILLSIGTGYKIPQADSSLTLNSLSNGLLRHGELILRMGQELKENLLDCEKTFEEYVSQIPQPLQSRYVRYNVKIDNLPALDAVTELGALQTNTNTELSRNPARVKHLAIQLVSTSFYFETERVEQISQYSAIATGK